MQSPQRQRDPKHVVLHKGRSENYYSKNTTSINLVMVMLKSLAGLQVPFLSFHFLIMS